MERRSPCGRSDKRRLGQLLLAGWLAACPLALAAPTVFESGDNQAGLLELYTSEGCSSCPPAEAWLAKLEDQPNLWKEIVPIAFHVDYWDDLGWADRFASPVFTQRQRAYAAAWNSGSVYTPEFVLNGREYSRDSKPIPTVNPVGRLRVTVEDASKVTVSFKPLNLSLAPLVAELAPLGRGVPSEVRRGENAGRRLTHEFVALALMTTPMELKNGVWIAHFLLPGGIPTPISGVAAWVHERNSITPLQATGGWF